ncbi:MAG: hypothetical protein ABSB35_41255 [Bryobacteraceae bacterium]|jgi:hypothetical protein
MLAIMRTLILTLAISSAALSGQETWNGFHFGMTQSDVQKMYSGLHPAQDALQVSTVPDGIGEPSLTGAPMLLDINMRWKPRGTRDLEVSEVVSFLFDKNDKLSAIYVVAKDPFAQTSDPEATGSTLAVIRSLNESLPEQYGRPTTERGDCNLTAAMIVYNQGKAFSCERMWKIERQVVTMTWRVSSGHLNTLMVAYKPTPKEI